MSSYIVELTTITNVSLAQCKICILQASLVTAPLELGHFQAVLLYWRSRFLDNASQGLLSVFGLISVRDLLYYLQYYSVPIATVLLSPVLQLVCACLAIYSQGEYTKPASWHNEPDFWCILYYDKTLKCLKICLLVFHGIKPSENSKKVWVLLP